MNLKGTKTASNLMKAFAGESQARNRYTFYASAAKKAGYIHIQNAFLETAGQEKEHAEIFYKFLVEGLNGGCLPADADYPISLYPTTIDNLQAAAEGEREEAEDIYPVFANIAEEEGFPRIAKAFRDIAVIERTHKEKYLFWLKALKDGTIYHRDQKVTWVCQNCGHIHEGTDAPTICPTCHHPQGWFSVKN